MADVYSSVGLFFYFLFPCKSGFKHHIHLSLLADKRQMSVNPRWSKLVWSPPLRCPLWSMCFSGTLNTAIYVFFNAIITYLPSLWRNLSVFCVVPPPPNTKHPIFTLQKLHLSSTTQLHSPECPKPTPTHSLTFTFQTPPHTRSPLNTGRKKQWRNTIQRRHGKAIIVQGRCTVLA